MILGFLIALVAFPNAAADAVAARAEANRSTMRLSDRGTVTVSLEGPAPLVVTLPADWVSADSASNWRAQAIGEAEVVPLEKGRERWSLMLRIDPYATGDPLALTFNPVNVRFGQSAHSQSVSLPAISIRVTTDVQSVLPSEARSITGIESVPDPVREFPGLPVAIGIIALAVALGLALIWKRSRNRRQSKTSEDVIAKQLAELNHQRDPRQLAIGIATVLRTSIAHRFGLPLDCRTAHESSQAFRECPNVPPSVDREEFETIMRDCERIQFDPSATGDGRQLLDRAKNWLETIRN